MQQHSGRCALFSVLIPIWRQHAGLGHVQHDEDMNLEDMLPLRQAFNLDQDDAMLEDDHNNSENKKPVWEGAPLCSWEKGEIGHIKHVHFQRHIGNCLFWAHNSRIDWINIDYVNPTCQHHVVVCCNGPFGQFRSFQRKSRKNGFFGRLETQNCRKEDFWRHSLYYLSSTQKWLYSEIPGVACVQRCFPWRKNVEKVYVACNPPQSMFWASQSESLRKVTLKTLLVGQKNAISRLHSRRKTSKNWFFGRLECPFVVSTPLRMREFLAVPELRFVQGVILQDGHHSTLVDHCQCRCPSCFGTIYICVYCVIMHPTDTFTEYNPLKIKFPIKGMLTCDVTTGTCQGTTTSWCQKSILVWVNASLQSMVGKLSPPPNQGHTKNQSLFSKQVAGLFGVVVVCTGRFHCVWRENFPAKQGSNHESGVVSALSVQRPYSIPPWFWQWIVPGGDKMTTAASGYAHSAPRGVLWYYRSIHLWVYWGYWGFLTLGPVAHAAGLNPCVTSALSSTTTPSRGWAD